VALRATDVHPAGQRTTGRSIHGRRAITFVAQRAFFIVGVVFIGITSPS
jgi:hypothetical protein